MVTLINTVKGRSRLKPRRDPYFQRVASGISVGYRKMTTEGPGYWSTRLRNQDTGKGYHYDQLGTLEEYPDHERYDKAAAQARHRYEHVKSGGVIQVTTIRQTCEAYVKHLRQTKSDAAAEDANRRFSTYVLDDSNFAALELQKLKPAHITNWRQRLTNRPIHRGSGNGNNPSKATDKQRSDSSTNRDMTPFRAALNHALDNSWITTDHAWRVKLKPIEKADKQRDGGYLTKQERIKLLDAIATYELGLETFVKTLCAIPIRPGALAQIKVKNYDKNQKILHIKNDKTSERILKLPDFLAKVFEEACENKNFEENIFTRTDGAPWDKNKWKKPFKRAVKEAGLKDSIVMYSIRHAVISDLITEGVDPLTVSKMSGTSMKMIEHHYGHLKSDISVKAIEKIAV